MNLKKFSKVLIVLCLMLVAIGGSFMGETVKSSANATKSIAAIGGGVMEDAIHVIPFNM